MTKCIVALILGLTVGCASYPPVFVGSSSRDITPFDDCVEELASQLTTEIAPGSRVLILDLTELDGTVTALGSYLADKLTIQLSGSFQVQVVDRKAMQYVLREQELQLTNSVDPETAVRMGRMSGAQLIIHGTLSEMTDFIETNAKVIDVEHGTVIGGASGRIPKTEETLALVGLITEEKQRQQALVQEYKTSILSDIEEDTLKRFEALQRLHAEIDAVNASVLSKLKIGMTLQQVIEILGSQNVHPVSLAVGVHMAGRYYLILNGPVLVKVVDGKTVNGYIEAVVSGRNVAQY